MATGNSINANQSGLQSYDGAGNWVGTTLTSSSANLTISNPNGVGGNPTFNLSGIMTWNDTTGTSQALSTFNGYVSDNASLVTFTLPATANLGDVIQILGKAAGGWKIAQNASQQINVGKVSTTSGVSGSVASTNQWDTIELRCVTAGTSTIWTAKVTGNVTVS
jgi:hypothetical protein